LTLRDKQICNDEKTACVIVSLRQLSSGCDRFKAILFVTNILYCDPEWRSHSNFLVNEIVDYLVTRRKATSDIGSRGYVRVREILNALNRMGFSPEDAIKAINFVHKRNLIVADHLGRTTIEPDDFVRAHASGFVHCRLLADNIHYLAGIVPSTYLNDRKLAERLGRLSQINPGFNDIQFGRKQEIVVLLHGYLSEEYNRHANEAPLFAEQAVGTRFLLRAVESSITRGTAALGGNFDAERLNEITEG